MKIAFVPHTNKQAQSIVTFLTRSALTITAAVVLMTAMTPTASASSLRRRALNVTNAAHRGLIGSVEKPGVNYADEDTTWSCLNAIKHGADVCEYDVHFTSDGIPVVIHDPTLDRTTNCKGFVKEKTYDQIYNCFTAHKSRVPRLGSFLRNVSTASSRIHLEQEIKPTKPTDEALQAVVNANLAYGFDATRITYTSAHMSVLKRLEVIAPDVPKAYIDPSTTNPPVAADMPVDIVTGVVIPYAGLQNKLKNNPTYVGDLHAAGLTLAVWGAKDLDAMRKLVGQGVDEIISDQADQFETWRTR